ncbi:MAG TPA: MATE family efflux transporter [Burkholderiales bacterium]|nr:MATE family efflux transporter [Burkholderiales bacterium]
MSDDVAASPRLIYQLPALRRDAQGRRQVSYRAVFALATPLLLNTAIQAILSLTDTWFIGRLSTSATAAMGATYYLVLVFVLLFGGIGMAVQTQVAQAYGGRRRVRAAKAVWIGAWAAAFTIPPFVLLALSGHGLLGPFGLSPEIEDLAVEYWLPRMLGGPLAVLYWVFTGFFNGIGRTRLTLFIAIAMALLNAGLNELFMFRFGWGMAGAGWATTASVAIAIVIAMALFLTSFVHEEYKSRLTWRPEWRVLGRSLALGLPMGLSSAVDLIGLSVFQLMQVRLGAIDGAASQIAMMLTSLAYMPAIGFGIAGTTLVGQSIGAGDRDWAYRVGNATIKLSTAYMGCVGILLALAAPWVLPWFVADGDPYAQEVMRLAQVLLWLAAGYQLFDGMHLGSVFCLRGAGDVRFPAVLVVGLSWFGFVPLAYVFTFAPGQGWFDLPLQMGWGATGGWIAAVVYIFALGVVINWRWRSGAWRRITVR